MSPDLALALLFLLGVGLITTAAVGARYASKVTAESFMEALAVCGLACLAGVALLLFIKAGDWSCLDGGGWP